MLQHRFVILLGVLIFFVGALPFLRILVNPADANFGEVVYVLLLAILLVGIVFAVSHKPAIRIAAIVLAVPAIVAKVAALFAPSAPLIAITNICSMGVLLLIVGAIMRLLFTPIRVTLDTISASLCVYILMVLLWAFFYSLTDLWLPGSFAYSLSDDFRLALGDRDSVFAVYFSFITITTLGYGDIVPTTQPAQMLAALEAFVGQMYVAILVARLVAVYSGSQRGESSDSG